MALWYCSKSLAQVLRDNKSFEDLSNYEDMLTISSAEDELFIQWENVEILKSLHNLDEPRGKLCIYG